MAIPVITVIRPLNISVAPISEAMIAGSPPPQPAHARLAVWDRARNIANPVMALFSAPQDRSTSS